MAITATPKNVLGLSVALLGLAVVFAFLNNHKTRSLRQSVVDATAARDDLARRRATEEKDIKSRETAVTTAMAKVNENETRVAKAEADLVQLQTEKTELQNKLQAAQSEVTSLQTRIGEAEARPAGDNPGAPSLPELQAQLDEARRQLENAEHENAFLSEKIRTAQDRSTQLEEEKKRRAPVATRAGIRGTVLAVNQAYNFVVLNLGGRQGVERDAEMLVIRDGTVIGKIRVSSVEPSTAIGDIITTTLAHGVQVQPGDIVVYAGTNS